MLSKKKRYLSVNVPCPWCAKSGIQIMALNKYVRKSCLHVCGYIARIPKKLLTHQEKVSWYGAIYRKH